MTRRGGVGRTTGIVIALALVPSITLAVLELLAGAPSPAAQALLRWLVDAVAVVVGSALVFEVKRRTDGRRPRSDRVSARTAKAGFLCLRTPRP